MDIAPDYGSGDWGFESLRGRNFFPFYIKEIKHYQKYSSKTIFVLFAYYNAFCIRFLLLIYLLIYFIMFVLLLNIFVYFFSAIII